MTLVREAQEPTRYTPLLEDLKQHYPFRNGQSVVQLVVDEEVRRGPVVNVVDGIPAVVVFPVVPEGAVELV